MAVLCAQDIDTIIHNLVAQSQFIDIPHYFEYVVPH